MSLVPVLQLVSPRLHGVSGKVVPQSQQASAIHDGQSLYSQLPWTTEILPAL